MAIIDLNNLIQPKQTNSNKTAINIQVENKSAIYTDLHLDLTLNQSIGIGVNTVDSRDISVDNDILAIKNSIANIFNTLPNQKVLNPTFGCSLLQFLFEEVSLANGNAIGNAINNAITKFEPRVSVIKVYVQPNPNSTPIASLNGNQLFFNTSINSSTDIGPGYGISVIYEILPLKKQDTLTIFAQIGGQILI